MFNISLIFGITFLWNRFVLTKLIDFMCNPKTNDELSYTSTSFFYDNKKEIIKIANYFYYILALFVSIMMIL